MSFFNFFRRSSDDATTAPIEPPKFQKSATVKALPASWYLSQNMFDLEKRAIFYKRWLLTTHQYRIPQKGDWQRYQMIDQHFVVCRDHDDQIRAFHAHRNIEEFNPEQPGLLPIHVHVDKKGFIWTNLDGSDEPVPWSELFGGSDEQERLDYYNWDQYEYDHTWEMEGAYNWKLLGDNYNECYHCRVAHPDLNDLADINTYNVVPEKSYLKHFGSPTPEMIAKGFKIAPTYFFPNASVNISRNFFMMQRFIPVTPESSIMRYEVYRNKNATEEEFTAISDMYKRVMSEDKYLALGAHANIKRGVFVNGEMHAEMEKGALWFQGHVRNLVKEHYNKEIKTGHQLWPVKQSLTRAPAAIEREAAPKSVDMAFKPLEMNTRILVTTI